MRLARRSHSRIAARRAPYRRHARSQIQRPTSANRSSTNGCFAKRGVVPIMLEDFAELMIVALSRNRRARGHDVSVLDQKLSYRTGVGPVASRGLRYRVYLVAASTSPSGVPPWRSSQVKPVVAKNVRPPPPSQNTRGRTTPRE